MKIEKKQFTPFNKNYDVVTTLIEESFVEVRYYKNSLTEKYMVIIDFDTVKEYKTLTSVNKYIYNELIKCSTLNYSSDYYIIKQRLMKVMKIIQRQNLIYTNGENNLEYSDCCNTCGSLFDDKHIVKEIDDKYAGKNLIIKGFYEGMNKVEDVDYFTYDEEMFLVGENLTKHDFNKVEEMFHNYNIDFVRPKDENKCATITVRRI